ncbi:hypothetical protein HBI31_217400 [Parastagonospora nodorum]|nr:hypothetical protein HBI31_217400 [Parastagonospora nodorum]
MQTNESSATGGGLIAMTLLSDVVGLGEGSSSKVECLAGLLSLILNPNQLPSEDAAIVTAGLSGFRLVQLLHDLGAKIRQIVIRRSDGEDGAIIVNSGFAYVVMPVPEWVEWVDNLHPVEKQYGVHWGLVIGDRAHKKRCDTIDDDVEEQQKFYAAAIILTSALIHRKQPPPTHHSLSQFTLPKIPLQESQQIITRADFIHPFDHIDITHSDANSMVHADSVPMQNAFRDIVSDEGFEEPLRRTPDRLDELEGLARTREVSQCEVLGRIRGDVPIVEYCVKI